MAGNRRLFEHAVRKATSYYDAKTWDKALLEFQNALKEFPDDLTVIEKAADVQERLGKLQDAAQSYMIIANTRARQGAQDQALDYWLRATRLDNNIIEAHKSLAFAFASQGQTKQAVRENLALARIYQQQNALEDALSSVQAAYAIDPSNPDVLTALELLRAAGVKTGPIGEEQEPEATEGEARGSPIDITREKAMSDLAESIFEDIPRRPQPKQLSKTEVDTLISQALDQQTRGETEKAVEAYRRIAAAGIDMPAVNFNLGLLYQDSVRLDEAIEQFNQSVHHTEYRLGSLFALGELYRAKGRVDEALSYFLEALKIVDLQTVHREQADDLIQVYESLAETYAAKGEAQQSGAFVNTLVDFLSSKGWEDKVVQARRRLDSLTEEGAPAMSLAEILSVHDSEQVLQSMSMMQELAKRGKYYSALEEAYRAIERAPDYLPLHLRLAEMIFKNGQTDTAINKFLTIANTLYARGDAHQAMAIYQRVLRLAPMDVNIRTKLIELLVSYGQIDRALEQYLALADTYYQLASTEKAREQYLDALKLAPRGTTSRLWSNQIMHKIGEMDTQRGDWKRAVQTYEQIKKVDPSDEKARMILIELYYKVQPQRAIQEIDDLLKSYRAAGKTKRLVPVIEDQVRAHPSDMALRYRAAQACIEAGLRPEAIGHLNRLGELQMSAGLMQQAIATLRAIVALNPPNVQAYKSLLAKIGG
jgi:tetratricopeptide (TPR) repeat protein